MSTAAAVEFFILFVFCFLFCLFVADLSLSLLSE